ncbi:MAG: class I SAM-dependent methyltransferase [Planctomycetota bacterium]
MTLDIEVPFTPLPEVAEVLVADSEQRISDYLGAKRSGEGGGFGGGGGAFVPADYRRVYTGLAKVYDAGLAPTEQFCEWGSGFGVVAALAAQLGFEACGIELEHDLVPQAEAFVAEHDLDVAFACGSFIPESAEHLADVQDDLATLGRGVADGYDELGMDPDDFGLIYAYPWPGEEEVITTIFDAVAASGALLLTYRSTEDLVLQRKV